MNTYVFITLNLCAMHGSNMYAYNKTCYLRQQSWRVLVFSAEQGEIMIPGLREYGDCRIPALRFYPGCFGEKRAARVVSRIVDRIGPLDDADEVVVESTNLISALWGEMLAERLKCKHLAYILQERFGYSEREREYLRFKLERDELAGISDDAVGRMLNDPGIPFRESTRISAYCNNTIDECEDTITPQLDPSAVLTVGSIGRLEKPYVIPFLRAFCDYARSRPDDRINLVMIGGTRAAKRIGEIRAIVGKAGNVHLVMTGYMFPVPRRFVRKCDVFVSASGAAGATYYDQRPTIRLNPTTGNIIGVMGLTFQLGEHGAFADGCPLSELGDMIGMALEKSDEIRYVNQIRDGSYERNMKKEFDRQMALRRLSQPGTYRKTAGILYSDRAYKPFNILGRFLPPKLMYRGLERARSLFK